MQCISKWICKKGKTFELVNKLIDERESIKEK